MIKGTVKSTIRNKIRRAEGLTAWLNGPLDGRVRRRLGVWEDGNLNENLTARLISRTLRRLFKCIVG